MKKLKTKLEYLKQVLPMLWQTIRFRIKVWWYKIKY
jgi:hypothetical protein